MRFLFAGDVVIRKAREHLVSDSLKKYISLHDHAFCNLEGVVGNLAKLEKANKRGAYTYNHECVVKLMKEAGFDGVTLANNHIMDYKVEGLKQTLDCLEGELLHIGAGICIEDIYSYYCFKAEDISVAVFSVGENQFGACTEEEGVGYAWMFHPLFYQKINEAKERCDYIIVICHCGAEELNVPLPEVRRLYRYFIDCGVDLVVGQHPHVVQGYEKYREGYIFYSLGNFAFEQVDGTIYNSKGLVVSVEFNKKEVRVLTKETICDSIYVDFADNRLLENANIRLNSCDYYKIVNDYCKSTYENDLAYYIALSVGLDIKNKEKVMQFIEHRKKNDKLMYDEAFILHNTMIETNRWIIERAIKERNNIY